MNYKHLIWTIICFGYCCSFGQIAVNGTVREKRGKAPLEGVAVVVKGTTIGVLTDSLGEFELLMPESDSILIFTFIGMATQEIVVKESQTVDILLYDLCGLDFFPYPTIGINYFGGLNQSPAGVFLDFQLPYFLKPVTQLKIGYQTNFSGNKQTYVELRFPQLVTNSSYRLDLMAQYNQIFLKDPGFDFKSFKALTRLETVVIDERYAPIFMGVGMASKMTDSGTESHPGYELGLGYPLPWGFEVYTRATYWTQYWQIQTGMEWNYRSCNFLFFYNRIADYEEFNVGIGYDIRVKWEGKP